MCKQLDLFKDQPTADEPSQDDKRSPRRTRKLGYMIGVNKPRLVLEGKWMADMYRARVGDTVTLQYLEDKIVITF